MENTLLRIDYTNQHLRKRTQKEKDYKDNINRTTRNFGKGGITIKKACKNLLHFCYFNIINRSVKSRDLEVYLLEDSKALIKESNIKLQSLKFYSWILSEIIISNMRQYGNNNLPVVIKRDTVDIIRKSKIHFEYKRTLFLTPSWVSMKDADKIAEFLDVQEVIIKD